jgi:hypothetical protein
VLTSTKERVRASLKWQTPDGRRSMRSLSEIRTSLQQSPKPRWAAIRTRQYVEELNCHGSPKEEEVEVQSALGTSE